MLEEKKCKQCETVKPISEFSPNDSGGSRYHSRCRVCESQNRREKRRKQYKDDPNGRFFRPFENESGVIVKRCTCCRDEKPLSQFHRNGARGYHSKCRVCDNAIKQDNYKKNPEKYRESVRLSARRHPDRARARHKRWASANRKRRSEYRRNLLATHPGRVITYNQTRRNKYTTEMGRRWRGNGEKALAWRIANKERLSIYNHNWLKANPHKHAESQNRRRARKLAAPRIEKIDRKVIIERDNWTCYLCRQTCTPVNVTLDHIIPLSRGGTHTADNLRVACRSCNASKGTRLLGDFLK